MWGQGGFLGCKQVSEEQTPQTKKDLSEQNGAAQKIEGREESGLEKAE